MIVDRGQANHLEEVITVPEELKSSNATPQPYQNESRVPENGPSVTECHILLHLLVGQIGVSEQGFGRVHEVVIPVVRANQALLTVIPEHLGPAKAMVRIPHQLHRNRLRLVLHHLDSGRKKARATLSGRMAQLWQT